jgi:hypothetical protein
MPISLPAEMKTYLDAGKVPLRALCLDLTIEPDIFNFSTRKLTISDTTYFPYLVLAGDYQSFGGAPADRVSLQIQNIDKAMSGFFHTELLESAPAEIFIYYPEFRLKYTLIKGKVSLVSLTGQIADFEVRSRLDALTLRIPRREGQALCPWATADHFDDGPVSDADAMCPYRDEGVGGHTSCPGTMRDCEGRGMLEPANDKFYFGGFPIFSAVERGNSDVPDIPTAFIFPFPFTAIQDFSMLT